MLKKSKSIDIFVVINIFVFLSIIFFNAWWFRECTITDDDFRYGFFQNQQENVFSVLFDKYTYGMYQGGYVTIFLLKFFTSQLPAIFNLHPLDFASYPRGIICGFFVAFLVFSITRFIKLFENSKLLFLSTLIYISTIVFLNFFNFYIELTNFVIFRYIFSIAVYNFYLYYTYKNIAGIYNKKIFPTIIFSIFIALVCATNYEIIAFSVVSIVIQIVVYLLILKRIRNKNNGLAELKFNKNLYIINFFFVIFAFLYLNVFKNIILQKGFGNVSIDFLLITNFLKSFISICVYEIWWYWLIFCIIVVFLFTKMGCKFFYNFSFMYALIIQLTNILGMFPLIFCGQEFNINFYLAFEHVNFAYKLMLIVPLIIIICLAISYIDNKKIKNLIVKIIAFILILFSFINILKVLPSYYKETYSRLKENKSMHKLNYIYEKMIRFYFLNNEIPYLPIKNSKYTNLFNIDIIIDEDKLKNGNEYCIKESKLINWYFPYIYGDEKSKQIGFYCFSDDALNKFYKKGGTFTKSELDKIIFERLKNDNFVLNKEINIEKEPQINEDILNKQIKVWSQKFI